MMHFFRRTYTSLSEIHNGEFWNEPPYRGLSGRVPFPGIPPSPLGLPSSSGDGPSLPGFADSLLSELLVPYPPKITHTLKIPDSLYIANHCHFSLNSD